MSGPSRSWTGSSLSSARTRGRPPNAVDDSCRPWTLPPSGRQRTAPSSEHTHTHTPLLTKLSTLLDQTVASNTYQTLDGMSNYVSNILLTSTISNYLTSATAASTYQPIWAYLTTASTITSSNISDLSTTISSALTPYLTTAIASSTYQTITNMSNYLTTPAAALTYQTIANMSSYITSSSLTTTLGSYLTTALSSSTYQTIANMSSYITSTSLTTTLGSYLTTSTAASTYAPKASPTFTGTVAGITATMVGLANVNNTSDANKPISTATQAALNLLAPLTSLTNIPTTRVQFYCNATGGLTINGNSLYSVTLASYTTGTFAFTFSGSVSGYPMIQCLSASASVNYNANLVSWTGSACTVVIKDSSNVLQSTPFWLTVLA